MLNAESGFPHNHQGVIHVGLSTRRDNNNWTPQGTGCMQHPKVLLPNRLLLPKPKTPSFYGTIPDVLPTSHWANSYSFYSQNQQVRLCTKHPQFIFVTKNKANQMHAAVVTTGGMGLLHYSLRCGAQLQTPQTESKSPLCNSLFFATIS